MSLWSRAVDALVLGPVRRPRGTLIVTVVLMLLAALVMTRVRASGSAADLLGTDKPSVVALQKVLDHFPSADELLVLATLEGPSADTEAGVRRLTQFAESLKKNVESHGVSGSTGPVYARVAYAASPQFMDFIQKEAVPAGLLYLSTEEVAGLRQRLTLPAMRDQLRQNEAMLAAPGPAASALARTLVKDPLRLREFLGDRLAQAKGAFRTWRAGPEFVSDDGQSVLIRIAGVRSPSDLDFCRRIVLETESVIARTPHEGLRVELSGAYAIAAISERTIRSDLTSNVIWSMVLLQAVFLIGFRNVFSFALAFLPNGAALLVAFGMFALIHPVLTPLTAAVAATLIACGIDLSVYLISFYEERRQRGMNAHAAVVESVRELAMPLVAASTTTVVGFAAIAFSSIRALQDFAVLGSIGLVLSLFATLWLLPALLTRVSSGGRATQAGARVELGALVGFLNRRARGLMWACGCVMVFAGGIALWCGTPPFETNLNVMHPQPNRPLETEHEVARRFGGGETMIVYTEADSGPELVRAAHRVEAALNRPGIRQEAHISGVMGLASLLPEVAEVTGTGRFDVERVLTDFREAVEGSGFSPGAFAGYEDFLRQFLAPVTAPTVETLERYPEVRDLVLARAGTRPAAITIVSIANTENDARVRDDATRVLRAAVKDVPGAVVTGMAVVGHDVEHAVRTDLPRFMIAATAAVVVLLLICLRSVKYTLLSLIPLVFGGVCLFAVMGVMKERMNLANTMAVPLLLGIGVDYGIFLVVLAQQVEQRHEGRVQLVERFKASFHAIAHTAITSIIGFGTLVVTSTPAVQSLGRVIGIGVGTCLVGAMLLLAPLLLVLAGRRARA